MGKLNVPSDAMVDLDHVSLDGTDFSGRKLMQFSAAGCQFTRCNFRNMKIDSAVLGAGRDKSLYTGCQFDGSRIRFGSGGHARFVDCSFRDVELRDWFCFTVELVECKFTGVLRTVVFNGSVPLDERKSVGRTRNEFRANDFSACELVDVAFRTNIDLDDQRLPMGPQYLYVRRAAASVALVRERVAAWKEERKRLEAIGLIRSLESELEGGQQQLFLRRDDYPDLDQQVVRNVFALLQGSSPSSTDPESTRRRSAQDENQQ